MSAHQQRLHIATKIHIALMREIGQGIDVEQMLKRERYARDVLLVCESCRGSELAELARQFRAATSGLPELTAAMPPGRQARPMDWSQNTSGFGAEPAGLELDLRATRPQRGHPQAPRRESRSWWQRLMAR